MSEHGPSLASDRHVALTLSVHMRSDGLGAWPSQETLARETGLSVRAVRRSLKRLVADRWLTQITRKPPRGRRAKGYGFQYAARLPLKLANQMTNPDFKSVFTGKRPGGKPPAADRSMAADIASIDPDMGATSIRTGSPPNTTGGTLEPRAYKDKDVTQDDIDEMRRAFGEIA